MTAGTAPFLTFSIAAPVEVDAGVPDDVREAPEPEEPEAPEAPDAPVAAVL